MAVYNVKASDGKTYELGSTWANVKGKPGNASSSEDGLMSSSDKEKLDDLLYATSDEVTEILNATST